MHQFENLSDCLALRFALEDSRVVDGPGVHAQPCLQIRAPKEFRKRRQTIQGRAFDDGATLISKCVESVNVKTGAC